MQLSRPTYGNSALEDEWDMELHPDKCCVLTASRNKSISSHQYTLHDHTLNDMTTTSYLGVTLQGNSRFNLHINNIVGKANKTLGFLRRNLRNWSDSHQSPSL